jgi:hypothetical protein
VKLRHAVDCCNESCRVDVHPCYRQAVAEVVLVVEVGGDGTAQSTYKSEGLLFWPLALWLWYASGRESLASSIVDDILALPHGQRVPVS